jgi:hypothetical protein
MSPSDTLFVAFLKEILRLHGYKVMEGSMVERANDMERGKW